jgi:hypothetical protein
MKNRKAPPPSWSMYPLMHDEVSRLLQDEGLNFTFHDSDNDKNSIQGYDTSIMGRFECHNRKCRSKGWDSMRIAITIRMYPGKQYNARVYHQRCRMCHLLSEPILDNSYAERIAYRLKKWCGVELEPPKFSGRAEGPHKSNFCEGCKAGHCSEGSRGDRMIDNL